MQADPLDEAVDWMQSRKRTWEARMDRLDAHLRRKGDQVSDSTPVTAADQEVLITRIFDAPREQVFKAWTDPDEVAAWYGPEHMDIPAREVRIDLRVGGRWEAHDGPAWRRHGVRDQLRDRRTRRAGADRHAL